MRCRAAPAARQREFGGGNSELATGGQRHRAYACLPIRSSRSFACTPLGRLNRSNRLGRAFGPSPRRPLMAVLDVRPVPRTGSISEPDRPSPRAYATAETGQAVMRSERRRSPATQCRTNKSIGMLGHYVYVSSESSALRRLSEARSRGSRNDRQYSLAVLSFSFPQSSA